MADLLIHLRRIILVLSAIYFTNTILNRILGRQKTKVQVNGVKTKFHFRFWTYLYAIYLYAVIFNSIDTRITIFLLPTEAFP